jgi:hypothetical protein
MPESNAGTGCPLHLKCTKCIRRSDWRDRPSGTGMRLVRTGEVRKLKYPRGGARMLPWEQHQYRCLACGHVGWTRHVDVLQKPLDVALSKPVTLTELAHQICTHLTRFESDPKINVDTAKNGTGLRCYYHAGAIASGNRVGVTYVSYQGMTFLRRAEAAAYLAWLVAGNVGTHWQMKRE